MLPRNRRAPGAATWIVALMLVGCTDPVPPERPVLEIAAVRVDPPSGEPGTTLNAEILHRGRMYPAEDEAEYEVAWLGGCHNPAGGDFDGCLAGLRALVRELSSPVRDTPAERLAQLAGRFGMGPRFAFDLPASILDSEAGFGVSHVFFAVCHGHLQPAPERRHTVPLRCVDDAGRALGIDEFNVGYATVYTGEGAHNEAPRLEGLQLDGQLVAEGACETDADCEVLGNDHLEYGCARGRCLPVVASCASSCAPIELEPIVDVTSFEPVPAAPDLPTEVLWVKLRAALHILEADDAYIMEGLREGDHRRIAVMVPEGKEPRVIPTWFVISDNRGAINWRSWELLVR